MIYKVKEFKPGTAVIQVDLPVGVQDELELLVVNHLKARLPAEAVWVDVSVRLAAYLQVPQGDTPK